jgi:long-chain fatty acid transport protein
MTRTPTTALRLTAFAAAIACALPALATNGYFPHGYGIKAKGMAGVAAAMAEDSMGGASNPAKMVFVGSRADIGLEWFSPHRDAERSGAMIPPLDGKVESDKTSFWVPEFGYNRMMSDTWSLGLTVYGNGGMNTTYPQGNFQCPTPTGDFVPANMLCGSGTLGVDLMQLVVAPTVAFKVAPSHSVGASLLLGYQRFEAKGLQAFDNPMFSSSPGNVTNRGSDSSTGVGVRLGYMGQLTDRITVGAAWSSKINMSRFDKYEGLFAEEGDFDIPSNYSLGVAFRPDPAWTLAFDYERINYGDTPSVSNPSRSMAPLGASNGPGFGWQDIDVYKLGVAWQMRPDLTLRAGFNYGENPIDSADVTFNILAPGVMKQQYTGGFTWAVSPTSEFSGAFMYAPRVTVTGASLFDGVFGMPGAAGTETIGMKQYSVSLGWSWKF